MKKVTLSLIIIYILNLIDYWQTMTAVQFFGIGVEANPIARILINSGYGWFAKIVIVPILLSLLGFVIYKQEIKIYQKIQSMTIYVMLIYYIIVVINNFIVLSRLMSI